MFKPPSIKKKYKKFTRKQIKMSFTSSVFDDNNQTESEFRLWQKPKSLPPNINPKIPFGFIGFKKSRSEDSSIKYARRLFFVQDHFLCYKRKLESTKISRFLDLKWTRIERKKMNNMTENQEIEIIHELVFVRNQKFSSIFIIEEDIVERFLSYCQLYSIFHKFQDFYLNFGFIDCGSFGEVKILKF